MSKMLRLPLQQILSPLIGPLYVGTIFGAVPGSLFMFICRIKLSVQMIRRGNRNHPR